MANKKYLPLFLMLLLAFMMSLTTACNEDKDENTATDGDSEQSETPACQHASDCLTNYICDGGECKLSPICTLNSNCPYGYYCSNGSCAESAACDTTTPCVGDFTCQAGFCIPISTCARHLDCPNGYYCDHAVQSCKKNEENPNYTRCFGDSDCKENYLCDAKRCVVDRNVDGDTDGDANPTDGDDSPTDGDANPTDGDDNPTDGDANPTDGDETPTDGDETPTDGDTQPEGVSAKFCSMLTSQQTGYAYMCIKINDIELRTNMQACGTCKDIPTGNVTLLLTNCVGKDLSDPGSGEIQPGKDYALALDTEGKLQGVTMDPGGCEQITYQDVVNTLNSSKKSNEMSMWPAIQ